MSSLSVWLPTFDSYCLQYADLNFDELWQTLQLFIKEESMEKIDEVTQIMSILIVRSKYGDHASNLCFFFFEFHLDWFKWSRH